MIPGPVATDGPPIPDATPLDALGVDALAVVDGALADAGVCGPDQCSFDQLEHCTTPGAPPMMTTCDWGCVAAPNAHCGVLIPSGGVLTSDDLSPDIALLALAIGSGGAVFDTETGAISNIRSAGLGVIAGVEFSVRNGVGVFRMGDLKIDGAVGFAGANAVAFVSLKNITVTAELELTGACNTTAGGPGGGAGANARMSASGGAGKGPSGGASGAGGGGNGTLAGAGGGSYATSTVVAGGAAGASFGDDVISLLRGGGGGGGGGSNGGAGGGGGGAIQLVAEKQITFTGTPGVYSGIEAGGCGGRVSATGDGGGGGGGAGGTILMEAPRISSETGSSYFEVIGGGGGAYSFSGMAINNGDPGREGGRGGIPGGGNGEYLYDATDANGQEGGGSTLGGGGGGGAGRMRFNTVFGAVFSNGGNTEPMLGVAGSTTTQGQAQVM